MHCIFCKIIDRQIPSAIVAENDAVIVVKDISPKAPVHFLIIPKKHSTDVAALARGEEHVGAAMFAMARELSEKFPEAREFKLVMNNGASVGQSVFHTHMHFLAGGPIGAV